MVLFLQLLIYWQKYTSLADNECKLVTDSLRCPHFYVNHDEENATEDLFPNQVNMVSIKNNEVLKFVILFLSNISSNTYIFVTKN